MTSRRRDRSVRDARVADRLHSAAIHLLRQLRYEDDASGVSAPRLSALSVVVFGGPVTLGQLAAAEQVKPPTMTRLVTGLEDDGLVHRKIDSGDARLTFIHATSKGRRILLEARARRARLLQSAVSRIGDDKAAQLETGVDVITELIEDMRSASPPGRKR